MHLRKDLYLVWLFARSYWLVTTILTAACLTILWSKGPAALQVLIYFKLVTSAILTVSNYRRRFPNDVFWLNFGWSPSRLAAIATGADLACWVVLTYSLV